MRRTVFTRTTSSKNLTKLYLLLYLLIRIIRKRRIKRRAFLCFYILLTPGRNSTPDPSLLGTKSQIDAPSTQSRSNSGSLSNTILAVSMSTAAVNPQQSLVLLLLLLLLVLLLLLCFSLPPTLRLLLLLLLLLLFLRLPMFFCRVSTISSSSTLKVSSIKKFISSLVKCGFVCL